jgi:hypothetical protein
MRCAKTLVIGILLAAAAPGLRAQAKPATAANAKSAKPLEAKAAPQPPKPAVKSVAKPTAIPAKPPVNSAKPAANQAKPKVPSKSAQATAPKAKTKPVVRKAKDVAPAEGGQSAPEGEGRIARRDPFESLVSRQQAQAKASANLPPGKAGLQVSTLRLDGIVKSANGMIAVVSNPQARTYFLREGDQLFDGRVEKIAMDGVAFHEIGKDAFGKPVERQVNKKIYSSAGEQQ